MKRIALTVLLLLVVPACNPSKRYTEAAQLTGGSPSKGKSAILHYGCGSCHNIPGVPGAIASVGPPLDKLGNRFYLAGQLKNTPDNLIKWVQRPQMFRPGSAMPNLGVTPVDAKDIAAYLYTLK
jgi:cytochrome c2